MKTLIKIFFATAGKQKELCKELSNANCLNKGEEELHEFGYIAEFMENDERVQTVKNVLSKLGVSYDISKIIIYTKKELLKAQLLNLQINKAPFGDGGPTYETEYNLSVGCSKCGTGAKQISPLIINNNEIRRQKMICQSYFSDKLLSNDIFSVLKSENVTGAEFRQVVDKKGKPLPWYQILPQIYLPLMHKTTTGIITENQCALCTQDGYFHDSDQTENIIYDRSLVNPDDLPDLCASWECFGISHLPSPDPMTEFGIAQPLLYIKPRVFEILLRLKVSRIRLIPITFI